MNRKKSPIIISFKFGKKSYVKNHVFDMSVFKMPYSKDNRIIYSDIKSNDIFNQLVVDTQYYIYITNKIIKRLATSKYSCASTCLKLVSNYYKDDIMLDLYNEIYITLFELYNSNMLTINNDKIEYVNYKNSKNKEVTSYFILYKCIADYLEKQKIKADKYNVCIDLLYTDDSNNDKALSFKSTQYLNKILENTSNDDISNIIARQDVNSFMLYVNKEVPKQAYNLLFVFIELLQGYTQQEIANKLNKQQTTISLYLRQIRKLYTSWNNSNKKIKVHNANKSNYGSYKYDYTNIKDTSELNDFNNINTFNDNCYIDNIVYIENCVNDYVVSMNNNILPTYMVKESCNKYELSYKLVRYNIEVYSDDKLLHTIKISKKAYNTLKHNVNANMIFTK